MKANRKAPAAATKASQPENATCAQLRAQLKEATARAERAEQALAKYAKRAKERGRKGGQAGGVTRRRDRDIRCEEVVRRWKEMQRQGDPQPHKQSKVIAEETGIHEHTVRRYIAEAFDKYVGEQIALGGVRGRRKIVTRETDTK